MQERWDKAASKASYSKRREVTKIGRQHLFALAETIRLCAAGIDQEALSAFGVTYADALRHIATTLAEEATK